MVGADFVLGLSLGLLTGSIVLNVILQRLQAEKRDIVRRLADAFYTGVAVKLARDPAVASAELFRELRGKDRVPPPPPRDPVVHASSGTVPAVSVPVREPIWQESGAMEFELSSGGLASEVRIPE